MKTKQSLLFITIVAALNITGCGSGSGYGSGNNDGSGYTPTTPAPAPTPVAVTFPVQQSAPAVIDVADQGSILTTQSGLSLYFFLPDAVNSSTCNGVDGDEAGSTTSATSCAGIWPPLLAADGATASGSLTLITRASGARQWAYKGYPLYTYINDSAQTDINGEGINDVWFLAREDATKSVTMAEMPVYVVNGTVLTATSNNEVLQKGRQNKDGFSLYTFDVDPVGDAACYGLNGDQCINTWPPLLADKADKAEYPLSVLTLSNGERQWAYRGKPLYQFVGDVSTGDINGDNVGKVWHLATAAPALMRTVNDVARLSATGQVMTLLPQSEGSDTLTAQQADKDQFSLYTFDSDEAMQSNCSGGCAVNWPAFLADERDPDVGAFEKFTRGDGLLQWAYNDKPLYFFKGDSDKGQTNGDGVNGVWHLITPMDNNPSPAPVVIGTSDLGDALSASGAVDVLTRENGSDVVQLADMTGFQLYVFDADTLGESNCNSDGCINTWPPLLADDNTSPAAPYSVITRTDGHMQWAINGQPLYFFVGDVAAGQHNGEAVNSKWWVARPAPVRVNNHADKGAMLIAHGPVMASMGHSAESLQDLTLYTFDSDVADSGESTCFGSCAETWPPLYAQSSDQAFGNFTVISRDESDNSHTLQWAYKGMPLYFFVGDNQLGDTSGDYPSWTIARP